MASKPAKKAKAQSAKTPVAAKRSKSPKKTAAKPARTGGSRVSIGLHGIRKIMSKVRSAGLESEFNKALGDDHQFVQVQRKSLQRIKKFVASKPELSSLHTEMSECDCPPCDPYCIYI
jgi:hypothetical protein